MFLDEEKNPKHQNSFKSYVLEIDQTEDQKLL